MKIDELITQLKKDPGFSEAYQLEGEKLQTAVALYHAREAAGRQSKAKKSGQP